MMYAKHSALLYHSTNKVFFVILNHYAERIQFWRSVEVQSTAVKDLHGIYFEVIVLTIHIDRHILCKFIHQWNSIFLPYK